MCPVIKGNQAEEITRAKARGVYKGRAKALTDAQVGQARGGWLTVYPRLRWPVDSVSGGPPCMNTFRLHRRPSCIILM